MSIRMLCLVLACGLPFALSVSARAEVTYEDGDFVDTDWTAEILIDTTTSGATVGAVMQPTGGFPNAYRQTTHAYDAGTLHVAHMKPLAVYDPGTQGAIGFVDFSFDLLLEVGAPYAVRYRLLLLQDGNYYMSVASDLIFAGGWESFSFVGQTEDDFVLNAEFDNGTQHPDFSASGSPMVFGFRTSNFATADDPQVRVSGIDNWRVAVHDGPTPVVEATWERLKTSHRRLRTGDLTG